MAFSYPKHEFWVVVPNEELSAGEYKLQLSFEGSLLNKIVGFYRSVYADSKSHEQHFIATSKFEPTYARLAFPCFDEPQLKSKFKISLTRSSGNNYIALSNMNQESEELNFPTNGLTTVHFANSVPISTYLICFIVYDFQSLEVSIQLMIKRQLLLLLVTNWLICGLEVLDTSFLTHNLQPVQYLDNKLSSRAIMQAVSNPYQITEMFDGISYYKGSTLLRMLESLLVDQVFRIGVIAYLKRFAYNNAETDDLWTEIQTATNNTVNVKKVMDTWTRQSGFPLVSAIRNGTKLTLKQQRFLSDPNTNSSND
ncbi:hypothetical protein QTP88_003890 [Uroleucon formosanum]